MTIDTIALTQHQSYQQESTQCRKVSLMTPSKILPSQNSVETNTSVNPNVSPNSLFHSNAINISSNHAEIEQVTYEKPQGIKLQLMVLVLERFLGRSLDIENFSFNINSEHSKKTRSNPTAVNEVPPASNAELISIDGILFQSGDLLSVEQWHSHEQQLNYQVQGEFNINDQELSLNYNLSISSERSSYSKLEMSAAALKDPLLVQFGSQGLGNIQGQTSFAINQDNTLDNLPIFTGDIGYLVYDQNNNQRADDGSELFGPRTGQGFVELAQMDSNKNGFIDVGDQQFEQLYLWQPSDDSNQTEQWLSLKEAKIQAISLSAISTPFDFYDQQGKIQAQLRQSSFAISEDGYGRGVHQVDVRI